MSNNSTNSSTKRAKLAIYQNPYAYVEFDGDDGSLFAAVRSKAEAANQPLHRHPYELIDQEPDGTPARAARADNQSTEQVQVNQGLSKKGFRSGCRQILLPYVPSVKQKRLPPELSQFIDRNERRTPHGRYLVLKHLKKYDISAVKGGATHFHRDTYDGLLAKLNDIESLVNNEEK